MLKLVAFIAIVAFFLPCVVISCGNSVETGIDAMSRFSSGIGNAFAIAIFTLFVVIFLSLFLNREYFVPIPFLLGTANIIMLLMTKVVFYKDIVKYLIGSYIMFIASVILSITGNSYYKKLYDTRIRSDGRVYQKDNPL